MRRRTLTLGLLLILVAILVLDEGAQIFTPLAAAAGLTNQYTKETVILPPTLYSVPAANYSFTLAALRGGRQYVGSLEVAGGRQLGFYVMDAGNFSLWRAGRPASLVVANPNAVSYNFTLPPSLSGTYYFVFDNQENSQLEVVFGLSSAQSITVLNPLIAYIGYEVLLVGVILTIFGLRGGGSKAEQKPAAHETKAVWRCRFCGATNPVDEPTFCAKCGRAKH